VRGDERPGAVEGPLPVSEFKASNLTRGVWEMHKLLSILAVLGMAFAVASTAQAGTFDPTNSLINFQLSGLAASEVYALPGTEAQVTLTDNGFGGHNLAMDPTVFSTVNFGGGTSLFTGVGIITNIKLTIKNAAASFVSGYSYTNYVGDGGVKGPYLGGVSPLNGQMVVWALGLPAIGVNMAMVGGPPGTVTYPTLLGLSMTVTGGPWATGPLTITDITTNDWRSLGYRAAHDHGHHHQRDHPQRRDGGRHYAPADDAGGHPLCLDQWWLRDDRWRSADRAAHGHDLGLEQSPVGQPVRHGHAGRPDAGQHHARGIGSDPAGGSDGHQLRSRAGDAAAARGGRRGPGGRGSQADAQVVRRDCALALSQ